MEPLLIGESSRYRSDLAVELANRSAGLHRSLPYGVRSAIAELVRSMKCPGENDLDGRGLLRRSQAERDPAVSHRLVVGEVLSAPGFERGQVKAARRGIP